MSEPIRVAARALSIADSLGYLGQHAISRAVGADAEYRIIGGHMVRLLQLVYPTPAAVPRSTLDADAAVEDVEVIGSIVGDLHEQGFVQEKGNVFSRMIDGDRRIEVNVLMPRFGGAPGIRAQHVPGVGQIDTLPELGFALSSPPLKPDVTAELVEGSPVRYRTSIPDLEAAIVLKAHSWRAGTSRRARSRRSAHVAGDP